MDQSGTCYDDGRYKKMAQDRSQCLPLVMTGLNISFLLPWSMFAYIITSELEARLSSLILHDATTNVKILITF